MNSRLRIVKPLYKIEFILSASDYRKETDARLLSPVFDLFFCCLPARWRQALHCGADYSQIEKDELGRYNMEGIEEVKPDKPAENGVLKHLLNIDLHTTAEL